MHSHIKLAACLIAFVAVGAVGCDPLTLPPRSDAGAEATGEGGTAATSNSKMIPAGAISVEGTFGGDSGFYSWVTLDSAGKVDQFSFSIPIATVKKAASAQLFDFLPVPQPLLDQTPIKSFSLMYLPTGHVPAGVYDVPHWEWHLHVIGDAEVNAIDCADNTIPAKDKLPANTFCLPTCLPKLGMHAFPLSAPEFNGQRFTHGVYGAYYGAKFIAVEPKILLSELLAQPSFTMPSYDPGPLGPPGRYPKTWKVSYNADESAVVLTVTDWLTKS